MWTVLSGIFGGVLRLVPELFKYLDAKNERKHELEMQEKMIEFQRLKGEQKVEEIGAQGEADYNLKAVDTLKAAIEGQDRSSGIPFIDGLSKLIRPLITIQWVVILYPGVLVTSFVVMLMGNTSVLDALKVFGEPEKALVSFIVDFWFVGRVLEYKNSKKK